MTTRKNDAAKKSDYKNLTVLTKSAFALVEKNASKINKALLMGSSHGATLSKRLLFELALAGVETDSLGFKLVSSLAEQLGFEPEVAPAVDQPEGD